MADRYVIEVIEIISRITVEGDNVVLIQEPEAHVVETGIQGPQGIPGDIAGAYEFTQSTPSSEWIINHNKGYRPITEIFDAGGSEIDAEVLHVTINQTRVYFAAPQTGSARLL